MSWGKRFSKSVSVLLRDIVAIALTLKLSRERRLADASRLERLVMRLFHFAQPGTSQLRIWFLR